MMVPDNRVHNCFKKQVAIDFALTRVILIAGGLFILKPFLSQATPVAQVHVAAMECVIVSFLMIFLQTYVLVNWEE